MATALTCIQIDFQCKSSGYESRWQNYLILVSLDASNQLMTQDKNVFHTATDIHFNFFKYLN